MRFARVQPLTGRSAEPVAALLDGDSAVLLADFSGADPLLDLLRGPGLAAAASMRGETVPFDAVRILAPLRRPAKIVAIGLNYADHTAEAGMKAPVEPLVFAKFPSSIIGPGEAIVVPADVTTEVDWEGELAVVIGAECGPDRRATLGDVAAYTVANDVSARDLQRSDRQWTRAKSLDTFCPLGPALVTPDEVPDVQALRIRTRVDGTTMQDATTADMIFDVATLLDSLTAAMTLEPGDVVLTGTPPGVGAFRSPPVYLTDGGVVTVEIDGLGELTNPVRHR